jgi:hypothetical protein
MNRIPGGFIPLLPVEEEGWLNDGPLRELV